MILVHAVVTGLCAIGFGLTVYTYSESLPAAGGTVAAVIYLGCLHANWMGIFDPK